MRKFLNAKCRSPLGIYKQIVLCQVTPFIDIQLNQTKPLICSSTCRVRNCLWVCEFHATRQWRENQQIRRCRRKDLKTYTRSEVSQHKDAKDGIWITFKNGVYDITDFVEQHPGGANKIMLAAGGAVDPFWNLYQQHFDGKVQDILRKYQIGVLSEKEEKIEYDSSDPYANDPTRHSALVVISKTVQCTETPTQLISEESYITPNALWYVRHHHPVPVVDAKEYRLVIEGKGIKAPIALTLEDLKTLFPKHTVTATMQCGGNRRGAFNDIEKTSGLAWSTGAISTAVWGGVLLRDVLEFAGVNIMTPKKSMVLNMYKCFR